MTMSKIYSVLFASFFLICNSAFAQISDFGDIDRDRLPSTLWEEYTWSDPGGWTTLNVNTLGIAPNDPGQDAAAELAVLIASNPGRTKFYFPAGSYYFKSNLEITRGDIWLTGDGQSTELILDAPSSQEMNIRFTGSGGTSVSVQQAISRGDNELILASSAGLSVGDFVNIYSADSGLKNDHEAGQIAQISSITGNAISLSTNMGIPISASKLPMVEKLNMIENVRVNNLKIDRLRDNADYLNGAQFTWSHNLHLLYVHNFKLDNVESYNSANHHVELRFTYNSIIENNRFDDGYDKGGGGHGYGVNATRNATRTLVVNNEFYRLRHGVVAQFGGNHSVVAYNDSFQEQGSNNAFIVHGRGGHNNLFEGNSSSGDIVKDCAHGLDWRFNTYFRNNGRDVGDECSQNDFTNVLANDYVTLKNNGANNYVGGNRKAGTILWGALPTDANIPPSLYLTSQPSFVASWPLYGPPLTGSGTISHEAEDLSYSVTGATARIITDSGGSQGEWVLFEADGAGDLIDFTIPELPSGTYEVTVRYKRYFKRGTTQIETGSATLIGDPIDMYFPTPSFVEVVAGAVTYAPGGDESFRFEVTGKNASATEYHLSIDRIDFVPLNAPVFYEAEDLTHSTIGGTTRVISQSEASDGEWLLFEATGVGSEIDFVIPELTAGQYDVSLRYRAYTKRGTTQAETGTSTLIGTPLDMFSTNTGYVVANLGSVTYAPGGDESFRLEVTGKNASATEYHLSIDWIQFTPSP